MKHKRIKIKQVIAAVLIIAITATHADMTAFAEESEEPKEPYVVRELKEERTENTTTYEMSDGTKKMEYYSTNVRYKDENGNLQDYDSELVDTAKKKYAYENASGDMTHLFPENLKEETPVMLEKDNYQIQFSPVLDHTVKDMVIDTSKLRANAIGMYTTGLFPDEELENQVASAVTEDSAVMATNENLVRTVGNGFKNGNYDEFTTDTQKVQNIYGRDEEKTVDIIYDDVQSGLAIKYTSMEYGVKENIVIDAPNGIYVYAFHLNLKGLIPVLDEESGAISLLNKETEEYVAGIDAPNMNDATGEAYSEDVYFSLEEAEEEDCYILKVHISSSYLNSEERVYPVKVDPSVTWKGPSSLYDTYVIKSSTYSNTNFYDGGVKVFAVGNGSQGLFRSYMRMQSIKSTLKGYYVESAKLTVYENGNNASGTIVNIRRLVNYVSFFDICWNNKPLYQSGKIYGSFTSKGVSGTAHTVDLTEYVREIANGSKGSYGIGFMVKNESKSGNYVKFYGFRSSATSKIPKFVVTYYDGPTAPESVTTDEYCTRPGANLEVSWDGIVSRALSYVQYKISKYNEETDVYEDVIDYAELADNDTGTGSCNVPIGEDLTEGKYRVSIRGVDEGGIKGEALSAAFIIDSTAPVLTSSLTPATSAEGYSHKLPTATWNVDETNFAEIQYSVNGGDFVTLSEAQNASEAVRGLASESENTIQLRAVDEAGNYSNVETHSYYYDGTAPTITNFTVNGMSDTITEGGETTPTIAWNVSDANLQDVQLSINGGAYESLGNHTTGTDTIADQTLDDIQSASLRAVDALGNTSDVKTISRTPSTEVPEWTSVYMEDDGVLALSETAQNNADVDENNIYYAIVPQGTQATGYRAVTDVTESDGVLTAACDITDLSEGIYDVYVKTYLENGTTYSEDKTTWFYFPDAVYDGMTLLQAGYAEDEEATEESVQLDWETNEDEKNITKSYLYARYAEGMFALTKSFGQGVSKTTISVSKIEDTADYRVLAVYNDGSKALSNPVSYERTEETCTDEDGTITTEVSYVEAFPDQDKDNIYDVYELWDFQTSLTERDSDGDGFDDYYEVAILGTNPAIYTKNQDHDTDGLTDLEEYELGTNPYLPDTDFDGYHDDSDSEPLKTDASHTAYADYDVTAHVGLYDVEESVTEEGITYTSVTNLYNRLTTSVSSSDGERSFYQYDINGNKLTQIEYADGKSIANTYAYDAGGNLTYVTHNGFGYSYEYEYGTLESTGEVDYENATLTGVSVGNQSLVSYETNVIVDNTETEETLAEGAIVLQTEDIKTYGNGDSVKTVSTEYRLGDGATSASVAEQTEIYRNEDTSPEYSATYNMNGELLTKQSASGTTYAYTYSDDGNTVSKTKKNAAGTVIYSITREYTEVDDDDSDGITQSTTSVTYTYEKDGVSHTDTTVSEIYNRSTDDAVFSKVSDTLLSGGTYIKSALFGKGLTLAGEDTDLEAEQNIEQAVLYNANSEAVFTTTTEASNEGTMVVSYSDGGSVTYTYNNDGNITEIATAGFASNTQTTYVYDGYQQLTYEYIHYIESAKYRIHKYEYDNGGNILAYTTYECSESGYPGADAVDSVLSTSGQRVTYSYDSTWKDKLISYNGQSITYDASGNPINYLGTNITWNGRLLKTYGDISYTYNENAIRTSKTDEDGNEVVYELDDDSNILYEAVTTAAGESYSIKYLYTEAGERIGFISDVCGAGEQAYYYGKNAQGDVLAIYDDTGVKLVSYEYDAWGNILSTSGNSTLAEANPIRYRGYYYDVETGLYYLQSRYYDSEVGRFLNADGAEIINLNSNLFEYANDNPVNQTDPTGYFSVPRAVLSIPLDMLFMCISPYLAPIKSFAKKFAGIALKSRASTPLVAVIKLVAKYATKIFKVIRNVVYKIPVWGRKWAQKINVAKLSRALAGAATSGIFNTILNIIVPNITIFLSAGGMIAGVLDYISDWKLDNKIYIPFKR